MTSFSKSTDCVNFFLIWPSFLELSQDGPGPVKRTFAIIGLGFYASVATRQCRRRHNVFRLSR